MRSLDGLRVVSSWGRSPADLDLRGVFPGNHVFFNRKLGAKANLDVDDTDSFGPETITSTRRPSRRSRPAPRGSARPCS
jgi:uncharacterized protein YfaP (DUF2135 family)